MTSVVQHGSAATMTSMPSYPDLNEKVAVVTGGSRGVDANLTATFLTVKSFLPGMIERHRGSIVRWPRPRAGCRVGHLPFMLQPRQVW